MSVLTPTWYAQQPATPRLHHAADLSPLSAASAGSPLEEDHGSPRGECYGGSLIMVQQDCRTTEHAAVAENNGSVEERLCSVVLNPLPSSLLQSLSAQGHVRMLESLASAACWPSSPLPAPQDTCDDTHIVQDLLHDLVSAVENSIVEDQMHAADVPIHRHRSKKKRKARRESRDSNYKHRKRSTSSSSSSYCATPCPPVSENEEVVTQMPRVNPIFVWVKQNDTTITEVLCEDYDKRNRIRLTKTPSGWRAIPRTERLSVLQAMPPMLTSCSHEATGDLCESSGDTRVQSPDERLDSSSEMPVNITCDPSDLRQGTMQIDSNTLLQQGGLMGKSDVVDHLSEEDSMTNEFYEGCQYPEIGAHDELNDSGKVQNILNETPELFSKPVAEESCKYSEAAEDMVAELHTIEQSSESSDQCNIELDTELLRPEKNSETNHILSTKVEQTEEQDRGIERPFVCQTNGTAEESDINIPERSLLHKILSSKHKCSTPSHKIAVCKNEFVDFIEQNLFSCDQSDASKSDCKAKEMSYAKELKTDFEESLSLLDASITSKDILEPPPAHAGSTAVKPERCLVESAADLSACKRKRRLSGILPCRSPLRLPPLSARPLPSPVPQSPINERHTPSPAHQQSPNTIPVTASVGNKLPTPAHQHDVHTKSVFLENLLSQAPLALNTPAKRPALPVDAPVKRRRKSEDITLKNLLGSQEVAPRSRLLELLTTNTTTTEKRNKALDSTTPMDALAQLRMVLAEGQVPDPLYVPKSRLASLLANPATEIPRLIRSPPPVFEENTLAVSLSRLQAMLRRPDSELLAWAAQDWAMPQTTAPVITPPSIKPTVTKPPEHKHHVRPHKVKSTKPALKPSLPKNDPLGNPLHWWLNSSKSFLPPSPTPEVLAALHALYGPALLQPNYFAPPFSPSPELPLWQASALNVGKPPPAPAKHEVTAGKPRIACRSLLELLAKKTTHDVRPVQNTPNSRTARNDRMREPKADTEPSCPRLWHPLFGSQKSDTWNWRPLAVHGD